MATATYVAVRHQRGRRPGRPGPGGADALPGAAHGPDASRRAACIAAPRTVYVAIALSGLAALGAEVDLDAAALADARRHGLHVLDHPGRVPGRPGHRQQRRGRCWRADEGAAGRAGRLPAAAAGGHRLDRVHACAVAAVLADRSVSLSPSPWFTLQLDLVRCLWAMLPAACLWGASFPLALAAVRRTRPGSRPAGRRRVRRQHGRRDRRRAGASACW